jgi:hypothetical protein
MKNCKNSEVMHVTRPEGRGSHDLKVVLRALLKCESKTPPQ